jgi:hypothetical protein
VTAAPDITEKRGKRNVALRNIENIAMALNVSISELLKGI